MPIWIFEACWGKIHLYKATLGSHIDGSSTGSGSKIVEENLSPITLHRYYISADRMRVHFDDSIRAGLAPERLALEAFVYMGYWYGGLYVVIEGWRELKFTDTVIDNLLLSPNVDILRKYRNGVFHFQSTYFDERFRKFMVDGDNSAAWVRSLNQELGRYFLETFPVKL